MRVAAGHRDLHRTTGSCQNNRDLHADGQHERGQPNVPAGRHVAVTTKGNGFNPAGGTAPIPTAFDVTYTSATTGCSDTAPRSLIVNPANVPVLFANPATFQTFTATFNPGSAGPPVVPPSETPSSPQTVQIVDNGPAPLIVNSITKAATVACNDFQVGPSVPPAITLNQCESLPVTVTFTGPPVPAKTTETCTLTVSTNAGNRTFLLVGTSQ